MRQRDTTHSPGPRAQRGVVALTLGMLVIPLLGFFAVAVDYGRMYVAKAELQNAADACALAAAQQLSGTTLPANAFLRANSVGIAAARLHHVDFQRSQLQTRDIAVEFASSQTSIEWRNRDSMPPPGDDWRYARCTVQYAGMETWFLKIASLNSFDANAQAIAAIADATSNNCGLPTGVAGHCSQSASLYQ